MAEEARKPGRPRRAASNEADPMAKEGSAEAGREFINESKTEERRTKNQERFKKAEVSYKVIRVINGGREMVKVAKVEILPEGKYQSLVARLEHIKKKWVIKVGGHLNPEIKEALQAEGINL